MDRTMRLMVAIVIGYGLLGGVEAMAEPQAGRFVFTSVEGGVLRLDSHSGEVALCARRDEGWTCETVPDQRAALERQIEELKRENEALRREIATLRGDDKPAPSDGKGTLRLPTEKDIEELSAFFDKMVRRFQDMIEALKRSPPSREQI